MSGDKNADTSEETPELSAPEHTTLPSGNWARRHARDAVKITEKLMGCATVVKASHRVEEVCEVPSRAATSHKAITMGFNEASETLISPPHSAARIKTLRVLAQIGETSLDM